MVARAGSVAARFARLLRLQAVRLLPLDHLQPASRLVRRDARRIEVDGVEEVLPRRRGPVQVVELHDTRARMGLGLEGPAGPPREDAAEERQRGRRVPPLREPACEADERVRRHLLFQLLVAAEEQSRGVVEAPSLDEAGDDLGLALSTGGRGLAVLARPPRPLAPIDDPRRAQTRDEPADVGAVGDAGRRPAREQERGWRLERLYLLIMLRPSKALI